MDNHGHTDDIVRFGFFAYLMTDCVLFAGLFAAFAVLRGASGGFGVAQFFDLQLVFTETILLLTSSFAMGLAMLALERRDKIRLMLWLLVALLLGLGFLGLELHEFAQLITIGHGPATSASMSSFFALLGTHGLHVGIGALVMLIFMAHIWIKGITPKNSRALTCLALFWHFLDIVWIFIFTFVYLFGAL